MPKTTVSASFAVTARVTMRLVAGAAAAASASASGSGAAGAPCTWVTSTWWRTAEVWPVPSGSFCDR